MVASESENTSPGLTPGFYRAAEVAAKLQLAVPTIYEIAKRSPEKLGAERFGRSVRFRRTVIDQLVSGRP